MGIQGIQLAKAFGLRPVAIDTGADKRDLCIRMGAEAFVDFKECSDVVREVINITDGEGAHGVFVTAPAAYRNAVAYTGRRVGAKVMCIGLRMSWLRICFVELNWISQIKNLICEHSARRSCFPRSRCARVYAQESVHQRDFGLLYA